MQYFFDYKKFDVAQALLFPLSNDDLILIVWTYLHHLLKQSYNPEIWLLLKAEELGKKWPQEKPLGGFIN